MNGVLVVDKPADMSSFDVVRQVRRWCKTRKVGHAGTLDPFATGVLPVAVGQATRLVEFMMEGDKEYLATLHLGISTSTQDLHGEVLSERDWQMITRVQFEQAMQNFIGTIRQVPPMYSAIKQNGQPLYKLARKGIEVERQPRDVTIHDMQLQSFAPPEVTLLVACSKGTYIRTLSHDLGEQLGCGAHLTALRRSRSGPFGLADCSRIAELQAKVDVGEPLPLLTPKQVLADWPDVQVDGPALQRLQDGVAPSFTELAGAPQLIENTRVCLCSGDRLVAVARVTPGGFGKRPGDFEILKVFPEVSACG